MNNFENELLELNKKWLIEKILTKEDIKNINIKGIKAGATSKYPPYPKLEHTAKEAFEIFTDYWATINFIYCKIDAYRGKEYLTKEAIQAKIKNIEIFIESINTIDYENECEKISNGRLVNENNYEDYRFDYLRLKNGFYPALKMNETNLTLFRNICTDSNASIVYGKYFLFYDWLKSELEKFEVVENPNIEKYGPPTLKTFILEKYFLNGCKEVTESQIINIAEQNNLNKGSLKTSNIELKKDNNYLPIEKNPKSIKKFYYDYLYLFEKFTNNNEVKAAELVEKQIKKLQRNYDLLNSVTLT